jgi:glycosyltransferase involved in cell wall biosynthesis
VNAVNSQPVKPRVLLVLTEFPPSIGGMQTHALYLSCHLADAGYDVQVVTYHAASRADRESVAAFDGELRFPVHRVLSRLAFWSNVKILVRLARQFGPDLIYCSTVFYGFLRDSVDVPLICRSVGNDVLRPWIAYPFRLASRLLGTPGLDNWVYNTFRRLNYPDWAEMLFERKRRELVAQSAQKIDLILANSDFTARLFDDLGVRQERVRVLVGGVDARRFVPLEGRADGGRAALGIDEQSYVVTTVCRLVSKKGVDFLLRTFPAVRSLIPEAHLLIVGDGRHRKRYQRLARRLDLLDCVTFAGKVDHRDVQRYYWLSDLFVLASRIHVSQTTGQRDAETMGRVLCEANAAGVPVIATRSGGIPSVIAHEQNGLLFEPDDEADYLAQLQRVRTDRALVRSLVETGRRLAFREFDWSVILDAHERYFGEALLSR